MKKQQAYTSRGKILLEKSLQGNKDYGQCHRIQTADNSALPQRSVRQRQTCRRVIDFECNFKPLATSTPQRNKEVSLL